MVEEKECRAAEADMGDLEFFPQVVAPDDGEDFFGPSDHGVEVIEVRHGA